MQLYVTGFGSRAWLQTSSALLQITDKQIVYLRTTERVWGNLYQLILLAWLYYRRMT